jgi:hypothetical protein
MNPETALAYWGRMNEEQKRTALDLYDRMSGDEPELMGIFPFIAAIQGRLESRRAGQG